MGYDRINNYRTGLKIINEGLLYGLLSVPSFSGKEKWMQYYIMEYARRKDIPAGIDDKGTIYLCKGSLSEGEIYPCVTAHMDTVHSRQIPFIEANKKIPLQTEVVNGNHLIFAEDFGLGGDDKAGIVIALTIMEMLPACKAVFFVEEEIGCGGSGLPNCLGSGMLDISLLLTLLVEIAHRGRVAVSCCLIRHSMRSSLGSWGTNTA